MHPRNHVIGLVDEVLEFDVVLEACQLSPLHHGLHAMRSGLAEALTLTCVPCTTLRSCDGGPLAP